MIECVIRQLAIKKTRNKKQTRIISFATKYSFLIKKPLTPNITAWNAIDVSVVPSKLSGAKQNELSILTKTALFTNLASGRCPLTYLVVFCCKLPLTAKCRCTDCMS